MKKILIALVAIMTLSSAQVAVSQTSHSATRTLVNITTTADSATVEAYSDTSTAVVAADTAQQQYYRSYHVTVGQEDVGELFEMFSPIVEFFAGGMTLFVVVVLLLFLLAPLLIILLIFYLIYRNRKQKMQLAEAAVNSGQPLPELSGNSRVADEDSWIKGIKRMSIGLGIIACCYLLDFTFGCAVGCIFFFYGVGLMIIAKTTGRKNKD